MENTELYKMIQNAFFDNWGPESKEAIELLEQRFLTVSGKPIHPKPEESIAISVITPKTTALAFDRVYRNPFLSNCPPEDIGFFGGTSNEIFFIGYVMLVHDLIKHGKGESATHFIEQAQNYITRGTSRKQNSNPSNYGTTDLFMFNQIEKYYKRYPTLIYEKSKKFNTDFGNGSQQVLNAALTNIAIVDEEQLSWKQVLEFRADKANQMKYKRLMRWLDKESKVSTEQQLMDDIEIKLYDYEQAINKHGIKTVLGSVKSVLNSSYIAAAAGAAATAIGAGYFGGLDINALVGGGSLLAGKVGIDFALSKIDAHGLSIKDNQEIAYIYEAKKKFT